MAGFRYESAHRRALWEGQDNDAPLLFAYLALPEDEANVRHRTVTKKLDTSGPSAEVRKRGWNSASVAKKREYADTVCIYRGIGSLEVASGWITAYWAGPAA